MTAPPAADMVWIMAHFKWNSLPKTTPTFHQRITPALQLVRFSVTTHHHRLDQSVIKTTHSPSSTFTMDTMSTDPPNDFNPTTTAKTPARPTPPPTVLQPPRPTCYLIHVPRLHRILSALKMSNVLEQRRLNFQRERQSLEWVDKRKESSLDDSIRMMRNPKNARVWCRLRPHFRRD